MTLLVYMRSIVGVPHLCQVWSLRLLRLFTNMYAVSWIVSVTDTFHQGLTPQDFYTRSITYLVQSQVSLVSIAITHTITGISHGIWLRVVLVGRAWLGSWHCRKGCSDLLTAQNYSITIIIDTSHSGVVGFHYTWMRSIDERVVSLYMTIGYHHHIVWPVVRRFLIVPVSDRREATLSVYTTAYSLIIKLWGQHVRWTRSLWQCTHQFTITESI